MRIYFTHIKHCLTIRRLLREHDTENLRSLYWYDMRLADAVSWRGILKVIAWGIRRNTNDEIAGNYGLTSLYHADPPDCGPEQSNPLVWNCRNLEAVAWHDQPSEVVRILEAQAGAIIDEQNVIAGDIGTHPDNDSLASQGHWMGAFLVGAEGRNDALCERCPVTAQVVDELPICRNFGFVMYSALAPGTHISPHCGSSNLRLRHHLGLKVPEPDAARIRVGTQWRHWQQSRVLVFDDSFEHEVEHTGEKQRVVLSIDVWHPSLTEEDVTVLSHPVFHDFGYVRG